MTPGRATALSLGFVGAVALGIWIGPYVRPSAESAPDPAQTHASASLAQPDQTATPAPRAMRQEATMPAVKPTSVDLQKRLKPVLASGMNLTMAAEGFRDGEQFAAVAHASRNLGVPFMVLKHRVLEEGKSLAAAIRELKPDVNAAQEANRARIMARADVAAITL